MSRELPWPADAGPRWTTAHAYTPNEQGHYGGSDHLLLLDAFVRGRLRRAAGDALCKPDRKFWGLYGPRGPEDQRFYLPTCKRCLALAKAHGIDLERSPYVQRLRQREAAELLATHLQLVGTLQAFAAAPEAHRERVQAEQLARVAGVVERCTLGGLAELPDGHIDPVEFRRARDRGPCGRIAVAAETVTRFPRCIDHLNQSKAA